MKTPWVPRSLVSLAPCRPFFDSYQLVREVANFSAKTTQEEGCSKLILPCCALWLKLRLRSKRNRFHLQLNLQPLQVSTRRHGKASPYLHERHVVVVFCVADSQTAGRGVIDPSCCQVKREEADREYLLRRCFWQA